MEPPLHKEYGGRSDRGILCTCEIGEDHSVNGVRLNRLPKRRPGLSLGLPTAGIASAINEAVHAELSRWASQFEAYADTLRTEAKSTSNAVAKIRYGAESVTWTQAATYLRSHAKVFKQQADSSGEEQE